MGPRCIKEIRNPRAACQRPERMCSVYYMYGGIFLVRMSVSVTLEHSYSNGGEGSVLILVSPFQRLLETGAQSIYMYIHM